MSEELLDAIDDIMGFPSNPEQRRVISSPLEPAVVIAGAGSGKTTVMAARVLYLVGSGQVRPGEILGLTFTNKAAAEFLSRVKTRLFDAARLGGHFLASEDDTDPSIQTYHAFAQRLLAEHGLRIGAEPDADTFSEGAMRRIAYRTVATTQLPLVALTGSPENIASKVVNLDSALVESCVEPQEVMTYDSRLVSDLNNLNKKLSYALNIEQTAQERMELVQLVLEFRTNKARAGGRDFTDQMRLVGQLANTRPEVGRLLREQFKVVLLDEYQDTSIAQRRFLYSFFGEGHPVTAVGDPFQAIYGWRGASVHNINGFKDHFAVAVDSERRETLVFDLPTNYRSAERILDAANSVAAELQVEHPNVKPLRAGLPGQACEFNVALFERRDEEISWIGQNIATTWKRILDEERAGLRRTPSLEQRHLRLAVLARIASHLGPISRELDRLGVPYNVVGVDALLSLPAVAHVIAYLRVMYDPAANPSLIHILTNERWNIGPRDLALLGQRAEELIGAGSFRKDFASPREALDDATSGFDVSDIVALSDALDDPGPDAYSEQARERFASLSAQLRELRRFSGDPIEELIPRILRVTGYDVEMRLSGAAAAERAEIAINQLLDLAADAGALGTQPTIGEFLSYVHELARNERSQPKLEYPGPPDAVQLMTVHAAKGLEFTAVVLPSLVEKVFPSNRARSRWYKSCDVIPLDLIDEPVPPALAGYPTRTGKGPAGADTDAFDAAWRELHLLDEQRLAYVAVTRAKEILIASGYRWGFEQRTAYTPSDYLVRIKDMALDGEVHAWVPEPEVDENPYLTTGIPVDWPRRLPTDLLARREAAAALVSAAGDAVAVDDDLVCEWDRDLEVIRTEFERSRNEERVVSLPSSLTTTALMALAEDDEAFTERLARPMPRLIAPAADRGTAFHAWVEERYKARQLTTYSDDELTGAADDDLMDEDLVALKEAFLRSEFAERDAERVEVPFSITIAGHPIRGRIDAVYRDGERWQVIDWKTSARDEADELQLAVYRLAWAQIAKCDPAEVDAGFHFVRSGNTIMAADLPSLEELQERLGLQS